MAINLVESVQQKLNVGELQKIDPDTGKVPDTDKPSNKLYQLAIPAVLTGLYNFTRLDDKNRNVLGMSSDTFLSSIFGENKESLTVKISDVSQSPLHEVQNKLEEIGNASIAALKENLHPNPSDSDVKNFLTGQRHNILSYLDPGLQLGDYLLDDTIDDSTNKMEGPVSDLMHNIGQIFSGSGNDKKEEI